MFQYQSFDDAPGMVDSRAKLDAFKLPELRGKSFFDVACNEGYYCGAALQQGASRVVGLDSHKGFLVRAKQRFPAADFICQSWNSLPDNKFDVVLFASALHYIRTEEKITEHLTRLRDCLAPGGVLVLEAGVMPGLGAALTEHKRSDGSVIFYPTFRLLEEMLREAGLAYRFMGYSEPEDRVPRRVMHCRIRKPSVLFLTGDTCHGKTSMSLAVCDYDYDRYICVDVIGQDAFRKRYPEIPFDPLQTNGVLELFYRAPDGAAYMADCLAAEIREIADEAGRKAVIVDGLDASREGFRDVLRETVSRLGDEFVVWTAGISHQAPPS